MKSEGGNVSTESNTISHPSTGLLEVPYDRLDGQDGPLSHFADFLVVCVNSVVQSQREFTNEIKEAIKSGLDSNPKLVKMETTNARDLVSVFRKFSLVFTYTKMRLGSFIKTNIDKAKWLYEIEGEMGNLVPRIIQASQLPISPEVASKLFCDSKLKKQVCIVH